MNLILKKVGANITLPLMVALWGMVTACQGERTNSISCDYFEVNLTTGMCTQAQLHLIEAFSSAVSFLALSKVGTWLCLSQVRFKF